MNICYTERFVRTARRLPRSLQDDTVRAIEHLEHPSARDPFHVYPLEGRLRGLSSLTINYAYQAIVLVNENAIIFLDIAPRNRE